MRHPNGIQQMLEQMRMHFHVPPEVDPEGRPQHQQALFQRFIFLSQVRCAARSGSQCGCPTAA